MFARIYSIWDRQKTAWRYVGQTSNPKDMGPHGQRMMEAFYNHLDRYEYVVEREWKADTQEEVDRKEMAYIILRNTFNDLNEQGLNFTLGGGGGVRSVLTKARMSKAAVAVSNTPEGRKIRQRITQEFWSDPSNRQRASLAMREANSRPEVKAKRVALMADPATRQDRVSRGFHNPKHQDKRLAALRDPEVQKKCTEALRRYRASRSLTAH
jgi:hypothetical protein